MTVKRDLVLIKKLGFQQIAKDVTKFSSPNVVKLSSFSFIFRSFLIMKKPFPDR